MNVRVNQNYRLAGSSLQLDKHKVYDAVKDTNQPNYEEEGLVFVSNTYKVALLLNKNEYVVVD